MYVYRKLRLLEVDNLNKLINELLVPGASKTSREKLPNCRWNFVLIVLDSGRMCVLGITARYYGRHVGKMTVAKLSAVILP